MLFQLGQIVATPGVMQSVEAEQLPMLLKRHVMGDYGNLSDEDKEENERALQYGYRIMSSYDVEGVTVWIITEHDRSVTTFLLPEEY